MDSEQNCTQTLNRYLNQVALFGMQTQRKIMKMNVFIHGLCGLGIEVAKNIITMGVCKVTLFDNTLLTFNDLSKNIFVRQQHVGKLSRAQASRKSLSQLNTNVFVDVVCEATMDAIVQSYDCVVVLDNYSRQYLINLNNVCRSNKVGFIYGGVLGLYGFAFVDFGEDFQTFDASGQAQKNYWIQSIDRSQEGRIRLFEGQKLQILKDDIVVIHQVEGMQQINGRQFKVTSAKGQYFSLTIGDTRYFSQYIKGGKLTKVKRNVTINFQSLQSSLESYQKQCNQFRNCWNFQKSLTVLQLHIVLNGMLEFEKKNNRLTNLLSHEDAQQLMMLINQWIKNKPNINLGDWNLNQIDVNLCRKISFYAKLQISPICTLWGGIISHEIIKLTCKYTPLHQWFHYQFLNLIPQQEIKFCYQNETQYSDYTLMLGQKYTNKMGSTKIALFGAGDRGTEICKIYSLMGLATHNDGKIYCFDGGRSKRQSIQGDSALDQSKVQQLERKMKQLNKKFNFISVNEKFHKSTKDKYGDNFWKNIDIVISAVDNATCKSLIDRQCLWYQKPYINCQFSGDKCSNQVVIPFRTQNCQTKQEYYPLFNRLELSTINNFPYKIQHTIKNAVNCFQIIFTQPLNQFRKYLSNPKLFLDSTVTQQRQKYRVIEIFQSIKLLYQIYQSNSFDKCIQFAIDIFYEYFYNKITRILHSFPADHVTEAKQLFWSNKICKCPKPIKLIQEQKYAIEFVKTTALILGHALNIKQNDNLMGVIKGHIPKIQDPAHIKKSSRWYTDNKAQQKQILQKQQAQINSYYKQLSFCSSCVQQGDLKKVGNVQFDKNSAEQLHVNFIFYFSSLRARNYSIEEIQAFQSKIKCCEIRPKSISAIAVSAGLAALQTIRLIMQKPVEQHKNYSVNLSTPMVLQLDPLPPAQTKDAEYDPIMCGPVKAIPSKYTKWDKLEYRGPMKVEQLKQLIQVDFNVQVSIISHQTIMLYCCFNKNGKDLLQMDVKQAIEMKQKADINPEKKSLLINICCSIQEGTIDCNMPDIKYFL